MFQTILHYLVQSNQLDTCVLALLLWQWIQRWKDAGFPDELIAELLDVEPRTIARWRKGETKHPQKQMLKRMQALDELGLINWND